MMGGGWWVGQAETAYQARLTELTDIHATEVRAKARVERELEMAAAELQAMIKDRPNKVADLKAHIELVKAEKSEYQRQLNIIRTVCRRAAARVCRHQWWWRALMCVCVCMLCAGAESVTRGVQESGVDSRSHRTGQKAVARLLRSVQRLQNLHTRHRHQCTHHTGGHHRSGPAVCVTTQRPDSVGPREHERECEWRFTHAQTLHSR